MHLTFFNTTLTRAAVALCLCLTGLPAATLTWDVDSGTAGPQDGLGNWLDASRWLNGGANTTWSDGNDAVFGGGAGAGAAGIVTLTAPVTANSLTFNAPGSGAYTLTGSTLTLTSGNVIANASATLNSILAGSAGLTKTGAGVVTLGGTAANTYTGTTTISEGALNLNKSSGNAIGGGIAISGGGRLQMTLANQIADTSAITMSGAASIFNGTGVNAGQSNLGETFASLTVTGGVVNTGNGANGFVVTGATTMTGGAGNTIFLGNSGFTYTTNSLSLTNINSVAAGNVAAANTFTLYGNTATRISSLNVGSGGITLNNSRINLRKGSTGTAGAKGSRLVLDGNVTTTGTAASFITLDTAANAEGVADVELSSTSAAVTRTFNIGGGGANLTIDVRVTNGASTQAAILKTGAGQLTFSGDAAYTGITTVREGTLAVAGAAGKLSGTTGLVVSGGGTLHVGSGSATASLNNGIVNRINPAATLLLGGSDALGGNFILAASTTTHAQTLAGLTIGLGVNSIASNAATGTNTLIFGGPSATVYSRSVGGYVNFGEQAGFVVAFTNGPTGASVAGTGADAVLMGATMNARKDFVTAQSGVLTAATYTATGTTAWDAGKNMNVTGSVTTGASDAGVNSLRFGELAARTVTLTGMQSLTSGMILVTSDVGANASLITGGALRGSAGGDLLVMQNNTAGILTIASDIQNNGAATGLTKVGAGVLVLSGNNTYTGATTVLEGVLGTAGAASLGSGNLLLNGGVYESTGTFDRALGSGDNQVQITGGTSGFSAAAGGLAVNLGGAGSALVWGSEFFKPSTLVLNAASATGALNLQNGIDLNGASRSISVLANTATVSGVISNSGVAGAEGLTKAGTGTLILTNSNTYGGTTTISAGALLAGNDQAFGTSTVVLAGGALQSNDNNRVITNNIRITANSTVNGSNAITLNGTFTNGSTTPTLTSSITGGNVLTLNGNVYLSEDNVTAGRYLQILGSGGTVINGVIANNNSGNSQATGLFLNGGSLRLTADNTYTGRTLIANGPMIITRDSNLGIANATPLTDAIILAGAAKLRVESTFILNSNRSIGIGTSNGGPATGQIEVAAGHTLTVGSTIANRSVNVDGSAIGIGGGPSVGSLTKADTGKLILSGNNTYSGLTTVANGILEMRHGNALGTTEAGTTVNTTGALQLAGGITVTGETLTLNGGGLGSSGGLRSAEGNNTWAGTILSPTSGTATVRIQSELDTLTLDVATGNAFENVFGARTLGLGGAGNIVVADAIAQTAGTLSLLKDGIGTVTLRGANTFTGSVTASAGRLILDYSSGNLVLPTNRELTFNGGTLEVTNVGGAVTLGNLTMTGNSGLNKLVIGASTNLTVGNTWTRNSTTVMLIDLSAAGSVLTASPTTTESKTIATGTTASLVTGSNFAAYTVKDASGRYDFAAVSGGTIGRLNATLALPTTTGGSASNAYLLKPTEGSANVQFNAGATVTGGVLRVDTTSSAGSLDVNGGKLVLDDLGFLVDGANDFTINDSSVAKTGTVEGGSGNTALFIYHYGTGKLTINAKLSTGAGSLAFIGEGGLVDWNSAANVAGATNIEGAVLRVSNAAAMTLDNTTITGNGSGYLNISNGGILELTTGDFTRSLSVITGTLGGRFGFVAGDGGGFSAFGADRFVDIKASTTGAASASIVWGSTAGFLNTGAKLILGSKYADHILDFRNNLDLNNGNQVVDVQSTNVAGRGGKLSGVLSSTNGAIQKIGQGILEVTGDNTYGGGTVVKEGTFLANNTAGSATGTGNVTVLSGARLGGNGSVGKSGTLQNIEVRSGGTLSVGQLGNTSGQQLKLITSGSGVITLAGTVEFDIFGNNGGVNPLGNNDQLSLTSNTSIALGGTLKINDLTDVATELTLGSSWQLIDWSLVAVTSGPKFTGSFTTFDVPILADGLAWDYSQLYTTGYVSIGVVPEPGRMLLLGLGLAALTLRRRRKQS